MARQRSTTTTSWKTSPSAPPSSPWHRREQRGTLPQTPVEEEDFEQILNTKLGRQLTPDEENYLSKVEKRYERVRLTGKIFDQDMVRLHSKWAIQSVDPVALWPEPPTSLRDFWNYIALALADKGLSPPAFLRGMADIAGTRESLREWRHASTVPTWRKRIREFIDTRQDTLRAAPPARRLCDFRLLITVNDARLQIRLDGDTPSPFTSVDSALLDDLRKDHRDGRIITSGPSELLLVTCLAQSEEDWNDSFRLRPGTMRSGWPRCFSSPPSQTSSSPWMSALQPVTG